MSATETAVTGAAKKSKRRAVNGIRPRGASSWEIHYDAGRDHNGKRKRVYVSFKGTLVEAKKKRADLISAVNRGEHVDPSKTTLAAWVDNWFNLYVENNVTQRTLEGYRMILDSHVLPYIGAREIQKLSAVDIQKLYVELARSGYRINGKIANPPRGLSAQSILHVRRVLSDCLSEAEEAGVIFRSPVRKKRERNARATNRRARTPEAGEVEQGRRATDRALEPAELKTLFGAFAGMSLAPMVAVATGTGLRRGEMLALRWSDLDIDKGSLSVRRTVVYTKKFGVEIVQGAKTEGSERTISIDRSLCELLRVHRKEQKELALKLGTSYPVDCLVFPSIIERRRGRQPATVAGDINFARPWHPMSVTKEFRRIAKAAGFSNLRLHDLRHTHATMLMQAGLAVPSVAKRLGHSTPVITLKTYGHATAEADKRAAELSGDMLRAAMGSAL